MSTDSDPPGGLGTGEPGRPSEPSELGEHGEFVEPSEHGEFGERTEHGQRAAADQSPPAPAAGMAAERGSSSPGKRRRVGLLVTLAAVVAVLVIGAAIGLVGLRKSQPPAIVQGDCVPQAGTTPTVDLAKVACGPGTLRVLARYDGTTDDSVCDTVESVTHSVTYSKHGRYVLCVRKL